jgi:4'-phosphopantetheinyl transferase
VTPVVEWCLKREDAGGMDSAGPLASLTPDERLRYDGFRIDKRRREWLMGRLTAKSLVARVALEHAGVELPVPLIEIARAQSGAPLVRLSGTAPPGLPWAPGARLPMRVSVSHSHGTALCGALWFGDGRSPATAPRIGVDLEWIEPRSEGFVSDFLTEPERRYWAAAEGEGRHLRANLVWSAKEAVLKVIERGLTADTWWLTCLPADAGHPAQATPGASIAPTERPASPEMRVVPDGGEWRPFTVATDPRLPAGGLAFAGRYREIDGYVATIAVGVGAI